jgi:hypothetical protein
VNDAAQCPIIVILDETGHCSVTCDIKQRGNADRSECIDDSATCADDYIIDGLGMCAIQCRLNKVANEAHTKCVERVFEDDD